jgi:voltage-gated potassium channel
MKKLVARWLENRFVQAFIVLVIVVNVSALMAETVDDIRSRHGDFLVAVEHFSIVIFTVEYLLRMWSCTVERKFAGPIAGRFRYALTPFMVIDFIAIAPFYLPFLGVDLRALRMVRLIRILRVAKLARYSRAVRTLGTVLSEKRGELMTAVFILAVLILLSSALIFHAEHLAQPKAFSSIPAAMWWSISTLSTVGYGDIIPITTGGKIIAAVISVLGIGMFALPAGILGAAYSDALNRDKARMAKRCPHCGKPIE